MGYGQGVDEAAKWFDNNSDCEIIEYDNRGDEIFVKAMSKEVFLTYFKTINK